MTAARVFPSPGSATGVIAVLWLTYGAFYFCRVNISSAVPGLGSEFGYSKEQIGYILGALKLTYGIGQFINGQLAERLPARWLLVVGMLCSAALNVLFGFGTALYFLIFVWACNGYAQSLGWTPCLRVAANWFPAARRGRAIGAIGTGYQFTGALTFFVAGWAADHYGWRGALYIPAGMLVAACIFMLLFLREAPEEGGAEASRAAVPELHPRGSAWENIRLTLTNPALWLLALSLLLLDACRYGFIDWGISHVMEVQGGSVGGSALKYAVLPLGGMVGAYYSGWISDHFFQSRRAPVMCALLLLLGGLTLVYDQVVRASAAGTVILLFFIGMAIFGPQVLLVGTAPADLARAGTAAAGAGFVNFMGYMGAFATGPITGRLVDDYSWRMAVYVWAGCAFGAAFFAALLWQATPLDQIRKGSPRPEPARQ